MANRQPVSRINSETIEIGENDNVELPVPFVVNRNLQGTRWFEPGHEEYEENDPIFPRIFLVAIKHIKKGEEIFWHYDV